MTEHVQPEQTDSRLGVGAVRAALRVTQAVRGGEMSPNALEAVENRLKAMIAGRRS
jgi:hypothetical protein